MSSEIEELVKDELRLIRSNQEALEAGLNRVYAHLIHTDKSRSETEVHLAEIAKHLSSIHTLLIKHITDEELKFEALERQFRAHVGGGSNGSGE